MRGGVVVGVVVAAALGVALAAGATPAKPRDPCFSMTAGMNSGGTNALFARRELQGGGYTWAAIVGALVEGYTKLIRVADGYSGAMPHFGQPMIVRYRGAQTWYILDEEGDAAVFCAGEPALLDAVRADYKRLNGDANALERAIDRVPPAELE